MATIPQNNSISIMSIKEFLGLNENPDGDTNLRTGELSRMQNFRITRDKHLQVRPGTKTLLSLRTAWDAWTVEHERPTDQPRFCGAWEGMVGEDHHILASYGGLLLDVRIGSAEAIVVGTATQDETSFFGFAQKVYLLNGHEYKVWDGSGEFTDVEGYIPVVQTATTPEGSGTLLDNVNRLTGKRRVQFSPDGEAKEFQLPERAVDEILRVEGTDATWTADLEGGKVVFETAPARGINTVTVTYRKGEGSRQEVTRMRYAELFNGAVDSRVFLYGDGSNKTIYSGMDENGTATAEYFPDLYEAAVGEANTAITGLVRHYSRMMAYKEDSAWSIQYGTEVLESGAVTAACYVLPVNRQFGNDAPGQVRLLENDPITLDGKGIYQWKTSSGGYINMSNTNAKHFSGKVNATVKAFAAKSVKTFNRKSEQEFYFLHGDTALIYNYGADAWYKYTDFEFRCLMEVDGELYGFRPDGGVVHISRNHRNDDGADIHARADTGSMDFGQDWRMKYSPMVWVALQPESNARITVTVETNRRSDYPEKVVAASLSTFSHVDFNHWSFRTNRKPQVDRLKLKVKKATFYKLVYKSDSSSATATVLQTDVQLRYAGNVK